jgi:transcriptional regulator CtsR
MGISDKIEQFITELLKNEEHDEWLELRRNELAAIFNCVPSQINYVITTRFNPQRGYLVESKRGGGGYVRIKRISTEDSPQKQLLSQVEDSLDFPTAKAMIQYLFTNGSVSEREAGLLLSAVSDKSLPISQPNKDQLRASIFSSMLTALMERKE